MGQWEPIVTVDDWQTVQAKLDDPTRVTNTGGTKRKHLGSGLFLCGVCDLPIRGSSRGYRCRTEGHINRTGAAIDDYITEIIARRLSMPDALVNGPSSVSPQLASVLTEIDEHHARIVRAERDYTAQIIEGGDLKRVRNLARAAIEQLERQRLNLSRGTGAAPLLGTNDPAGVFRTANIDGQRRIIDTLTTVTLHPAMRGRKGFDPAPVTIAWKNAVV